jgi:TolA-binding protein
MADAAKAGADPKSGGNGSSEGGAVRREARRAEGEAAGVEGLLGRLARLDRIVTIRTRVGLVLLAIGIGCAAAAAYLAIDTRQDNASEEEVRELRSELERAAGAGGAETAALEAQLDRLRARVRSLAADQAALREAAAESTRNATGERGRGRAEPEVGAGGEAGSGEAGAAKGGSRGAIPTGDGE